MRDAERSEPSRTSPVRRQRSPAEPGREQPAGRARPADEFERRLLLGVLAVGFLVVGTWALVAPASFHAYFPFERAWVALDGPFNEHLLRDVGALQVALAVVVVAAIRRRSLTGVAAWATLAFALPHLLYHATHLAPFGVADAVAQVAALVVQVVVPVRLLSVGTRRSASGSTSPPSSWAASTRRAFGPDGSGPTMSAPSRSAGTRSAGTRSAGSRSAATRSAAPPLSGSGREGQS